MSILRVKRTPGYTTVPNKTLHDKRLSFRARGVLVFLLAHPNDWEITTSDLSSFSQEEGRDACSKAIKELRDLGYVSQAKENYQSPEGRSLWRTITTVSDAPTEDGFSGLGTEDGFSGSSLQPDTGSETTGRRLRRKTSSFHSSAPQGARGTRPKKNRPGPEVYEDPQSTLLAELDDTQPPAPAEKKDPLAQRTRQPRSLSDFERLVRYFKEESEKAEDTVPGETNDAALGKQIGDWLRKGHDYNLIRDMIDAYWHPTFKRNPNALAWRDFLASRDRLFKQAKKAAKAKSVEDDRYNLEAWGG